MNYPYWRFPMVNMEGVNFAHAGFERERASCGPDFGNPIFEQFRQFPLKDKLRRGALDFFPLEPDLDPL